MNADAVNETLRQCLADDVERDVWDEAPTLGLIIETAGGDIALAKIPVSDTTWGAAEPYRIIHFAASFAESGPEGGWGSPPLESGDSLVGAVLFSEGWGVSSTEPQAAAVLKAWVDEGHRLVDHPLAVEVKMVSAVLADESSVMLTYGRRGVKLPNTDQASVEGRIPDALRHLLTSFQSFAKEDAS